LTKTKNGTGKVTTKKCGAGLPDDEAASDEDDDEDDDDVAAVDLLRCLMFELDFSEKPEG